MENKNNISMMEAAQLIADMCAQRDTCLDCCFCGMRGCMFTVVDGYDSGRSPTEWEFLSC